MRGKKWTAALQRRISKSREGEGESDAASAGGELLVSWCGVLFTPL